MSLEIARPVADFTATATDGHQIKLSELGGKQVVIYFYPRASTPGCTTEGGDFRDHKTAFDDANTVILGVSRDGLKAQQNFKDKQAFNFDLISDKQEALCKQFDVIKLKKLYGKEHFGIERSTFLIDRQGRLIREWRKVKVKGHVEEVLEAAQALHLSSESQVD